MLTTRMLLAAGTALTVTAGAALVGIQGHGQEHLEALVLQVVLRYGLLSRLCPYREPVRFGAVHVPHFPASSADLNGYLSRLCSNVEVDNAKKLDAISHLDLAMADTLERALYVSRENQNGKYRPRSRLVF